MNTLGVLAGVGIIICASLVRATGDDPAAAAKAFYEALNDGASEKVERMKSAVTLANDAMAPPAVRTIRAGAASAVTRGGMITEVEVLGTRIYGSRAWVDVVLHYKDGSSQKFNAGLTREDGAWKVADD
jgi:hypothetical protein